MFKITMPLVLVFTLMACTGLSEQNNDRVNHVVLVWFNDDVDEGYIETVKRETEKLAGIPQVLYLDTGYAIESERSIVDDSFDIGVLFQFENKQNMDQYLVHPRHKKFVNDYLKGRVSRLQVYDF